MEKRLANRQFGLGAALLIVSALAGCTSERIVTSQALGSTLIVQARDSSELDNIAQALGWPSGVVPGADVTAQLKAEYAYQALSVSGSTDSSGTTRLESLVPGSYTVRVSRQFSQEERTRAGSVLGGVFRLEGLGTLTVVPGAGTMQLNVLVRPLGGGSLVFSEIFNAYADLGDGSGNYTEFAEYVKIYNNSDTTVQLAGKLFLEGFAGYRDYGLPTRNCTTYDAVTADPAGIWADWVYRFPPGAAALAPGAGVLIATDAIDQRTLGKGPGLQDLSHAQFEFRGNADVDNPLSQDMISVGPEDGGTPLGHGWMRFPDREAIALAVDVDLDTLPRKFLSINGGTTWVRIPTSALIDVVMSETTYQSAYSDCKPEVYWDIDAAEARLLAPVDYRSMHRRVLDTLPDGRIRLQQSRNSAVDFEIGPQTPGKIP